jgi:hypothetical protein
MKFLVTFAILLASSYTEGQSTPAGERLVDFESRNAGLTETLLEFAVQRHLPIAIEYIDSESMNRPIKVSETKPSLMRSISFCPMVRVISGHSQME